MTKTRSTVLEKQETRLKENLKEQESKITEMMKCGSANAPPTNPPSVEDNPRK
jgi:prefoldin beta subunit